MYQRILVPVDGSHTSTRGVQEAIRIAREQRARLRFIHIVDELVVAQNLDGYFNSGDLLDALRDAGKKVLQNAETLARKSGVDAETAIFEGVGLRIADIVVREAKKWKADVIVMGTHGRRGVRRMVLGSDAEAVLHAAPVPVLMVRAPDAKQRVRKK